MSKTTYLVETLHRDGRVIFTTTRKTRAAADKYAAQVAAKPENVRYGVTTRVREV